MRTKSFPKVAIRCCKAKQEHQEPVHKMADCRLPPSETQHKISKKATGFIPERIRI